MFDDCDHLCAVLSGLSEKIIGKRKIYLDLWEAVSWVFSGTPKKT